MNAKPVTTEAERIYSELDYDHDGASRGVDDATAHVNDRATAVGAETVTRWVLPTRAPGEEVREEEAYEVEAYRFSDGSQLADVGEGNWDILDHFGVFDSDDGREIIDLEQRTHCLAEETVDARDGE